LLFPAGSRACPTACGVSGARRRRRSAAGGRRDAAGQDLIAKVQEGLSADVALVLLSPRAVPGRWILERWRSVFWEQAAEVGTPVAALLCEDCKFPELLRRKIFLRPARPSPGSLSFDQAMAAEPLAGAAPGALRGGPATIFCGTRRRAGDAVYGPRRRARYGRGSECQSRIGQDRSGSGIRL
jgi:hypothetical protein